MDLCSLGLRQLSELKSLVESYKSEQFSQTFERVTHSTSGDRLYAVEGQMLHVFVVVWSGGTKFTSKVKSVAYKTTLQLSNKILLFDVDMSDKKIAVVHEKSPSLITFYDIETPLFGATETGVKLDKPLYTAETFSTIVDFYWAKDELLDEFAAGSFVIVQTKESLLIFGESQSKQMRKVFSLQGTFSDTYRLKFTFFVEIQSENRRLSAVLSHLEGNIFTQYLITNLESKKQTIVNQITKFTLDFGGFKRILSFEVASMDHLTVLLSDPETTISKYILSLSEQKDAEIRSKETMILGKHVACSFYVYNANSSCVYGKIDDTLEEFDAYKTVAAEKLGFKSLKFETTQLDSDSYWSLINETQFVIISPSKRTIRNFYIDKESIAVAKDELTIDFPEDTTRLKKNAVRFLRVSKTRLAFGVETQTLITIFETSFSMRQIESVSKVWTINKQSEFNTNDVIFFQLNLLKTPQVVYKVYALTAPRRLAAVEFDFDSRQAINHQVANLPEDVNEIYKCKQFPYNIIVLTVPENLIVLNNRLQPQTKFALENLRPFLSAKHRDDPITPNFNLKHLYDRFYIVISSVLCIWKNFCR